MKVVSTLLALGLLSMGHGLDFYSRAARLPVLMKEVETATGRTLRVDDELRNEVLYINVKGVEEQVLLDLIAEAADARWRSTSTSMVLEPDVAKRKRQAEAELNALRDAFLADLELVANSESEYSSETELIKLLRRMPVSVLKRSYPNRVVFSSSPNAAQHPLPASADRLVAEIIAAEQLLPEAVNGVLRENPLMFDGMSDFLRRIGRSDILRASANPPGSPAKVLISFEFSPLASGRSEATVKVVVLDDKGLKVGSDEIELRKRADRIRGYQPRSSAGEPSASLDPAFRWPLVFRDESKELLSFDMGGAATIRKYPNLLSWMDQPDVYDILSFTISDAWDNWAKYYQRSVIVNPDDQNIMVHDHLPSWPKTVGDFDVEARRRNEFAEVKGVNIVKPKRPNHARFNRMDRLAMRQNLEQGRLNGDLPEANARAALSDSRVPYASSSTAEAWYTVFTGLPSDLLAQRDHIEAGWQLWNRLSLEQREKLAKGESVAADTLSDEARSLIKFYAWDTFEGVQDVSARFWGLDGLIQAELEGEEGDPTKSTLPHFEPTEVWPNGFEVTGSIRPWGEEQMLIIPVDAEGDAIEAYGFRDVEGFAWDLTVEAMGEEASDIVEWSHFKVGTIQRLHLRIQLTPYHELRPHIEITKMGASSTVYTKNNLPPHVRAEVERVQKRIAESGVIEHLRRKNENRGSGEEVEPPILN